jgi:membrane protein DedA with SNARE-associated domain
MANFFDLIGSILFTPLGYGVNLILQIISAGGYFGIFALMILESAFMPVPSEVVMPFGGYLASQGKFDIVYVTLAGTFGNIVGSVISYFVGLYVGRSVVLKYGKYLFFKEKYLVMTENWFKKYGDKAIFFSRLLPVVRTVISLPAGVGKMNFSKFVLYSFIGSIPWNFALTYLGYWLGTNWEEVLSYGHIFNIIIILAIGILAVWFLLKRKRK